MRNNDHNFQQFLEAANGQKEASLVIAQNDRELKIFKQDIEAKGFREVAAPSEIINSPAGSKKAYITAHDPLPKSLYDFLVQYPTGQIEIFDNTAMRSALAIPDYQNLSVIVLVTRAELAALQGRGMNLAAFSGLAYQK